MTKIITLPNRTEVNKSTRKIEDYNDFISLVKDMSDLLKLIDQSLENTPNNETKNLNRRG